MRDVSSDAADVSTEILRDRYEIGELLGQGGQAKTFLARDLRSDGAQVVAKILQLEVADSWKSVELFEREAETLVRLDHPRIPDYIDHFHLDAEEDGSTRFVLVQDYVEGEDLEQVVEAGRRWDDEQAQRRLGQLAEILAYLHDLDPPVVHRDIKPSNLIVGPDDDLYLVDFGAAQNVVATTTGGSTIIGTTGYVPMEQYMGRATPASDIYALGATAVHMMTGQHPADLPFEEGELRFRDALGESALKPLLTAMLHPVAERRPATGAELARQLERMGDHGHSTDAVPETDILAIRDESSRALLAQGTSGSVIYRDDDRHWLTVTRQNNSRTLQRRLAPVEVGLSPFASAMIDTKPSEVRVKFDPWVNWRAWAVVAVIILFLGTALYMKGFALLWGLPLVFVWLKGRDEFVLDRTRFRVAGGALEIPFDELTEFDESPRGLIVRTRVEEHCIPWPQLPQDGRTYIVAVLNDARFQLDEERTIDTTEVW